MDEQEAQRRDEVLRAYFQGRDWDRNSEFGLKRRLVLDRLLEGYPYVIDDEWEAVPDRGDRGRGDLVFTDGHGAYAVVEVKYIDLEDTERRGSTRRTSNRKKRRKVEEQARAYARILFERLGPPARVEAYWFTNQHEAPVLEGVVPEEEGPVAR